VPRPADIAGRAPRRTGALLVATFVLRAASARADSDRLVLGTHDAALASALSVAVSPRGLSVVELPEALVGITDGQVARREIAVPGTVAIVWLCDDATSAHALCFCGVDGRIVVRPLSVTSPLTPPDAAAVALSVKMLLGAPPPPAPAPPPPSAPRPPPTAAPTAVPTLPVLSLEVDVGARLQSPSAQHVGLHVGLKGVLMPEVFGHALGAGVGLATGPALAARTPVGRTIDDASIDLFARGRLVVAPLWLELDAGPSVHFLSVDAGPGAPRRTDVALDALGGAVLPVGRALLGVRIGGFYVLTSPTGAAATSVALPRWNGEALATLGWAFR
jgi:hypothetical protein